MSNFSKLTKNPKTGLFEMATWLDNYFGQYRYAVRFGDGTVYDPDKVELETSRHTSVRGTNPIIPQPEHRPAQPEETLVYGHRGKFITIRIDPLNNILYKLRPRKNGQIETSAERVQAVQEARAEIDRYFNKLADEIISEDEYYTKGNREGKAGQGYRDRLRAEQRKVKDSLLKGKE